MCDKTSKGRGHVTLFTVRHICAAYVAALWYNSHYGAARVLGGIVRKRR